MDISKIKVIKKLGTGMLGTVYLIEYYNNQYAMKIQKILEEEKTQHVKFPIWRELFFYKDVNKMSLENQKFFCKLYAYKIFDNCKHKQKRSKEVPKNSMFVKRFQEMNASNICIVFIIDYKGSNTLFDFLQSNISTNQIYSILIQVCKIILLLSNMKYSHNDLHPANLMIIPTKDKTFEIMGNQIPYYGIQVVASDYGNMTNESYWKSYSEDEETYYFLELTRYLFYIIQNLPKLEKDCRIQKKKFPYEVKKDYKDYFWKKIFEKYKKIVDEYAEQYLRLYPYLRKFYYILRKNIKNFTVDNIKKKFKNKNDINVFLLKIENHFALEYPQLYMKLSGWCSPPLFILPKKDVLEILGCKTRENYVTLFMKKI